MRVDFDVKVCNTDLRGYILALDGSIFVWIGKSGISSLSLCHYPTSTLLLESPQSLCIKGFNTMVAKMFQDKQVFVSSDLEEDEPRFWQELFAEIKPHLEKVALPGRVQSITIQ